MTKCNDVCIVCIRTYVKMFTAFVCSSKVGTIYASSLRADHVHVETKIAMYWYSLNRNDK
jgi:hypothetical protein